MAHYAAGLPLDRVAPGSSFRIRPPGITVGQVLAMAMRAPTFGPLTAGTFIRGFGKRKVAQMLKEAGYETFEGGKTGYDSYVQKVLRNRATFGEMQPYKRDEEGRRVLAGPALKGYYAAAVTEADFLLANSLMEGRATSGGRPVKAGDTNLLMGLAYSPAAAE